MTTSLVSAAAAHINLQEAVERPQPRVSVGSIPYTALKPAAKARFIASMRAQGIDATSYNDRIRISGPHDKVHKWLSQHYQSVEEAEKKHPEIRKEISKSKPNLIPEPTKFAEDFYNKIKDKPRDAAGMEMSLSVMQHLGFIPQDNSNAEIAKSNAAWVDYHKKTATAPKKPSDDEHPEVKAAREAFEKAEGEWTSYEGDPDADEEDEDPEADRLNAAAHKAHDHWMKVKADKESVKGPALGTKEHLDATMNAYTAGKAKHEDVAASAEAYEKAKASATHSEAKAAWDEYYKWLDENPHKQFSDPEVQKRYDQADKLAKASAKKPSEDPHDEHMVYVHQNKPNGKEGELLSSTKYKGPLSGLDAFSKDYAEKTWKGKAVTVKTKNLTQETKENTPSGDRAEILAEILKALKPFGTIETTALENALDGGTTDGGKSVVQHIAARAENLAALCKMFK